MKPGRRQFIASSLLAAGAFPFPASAQDRTKPSGEAKTVSLRGKVVCLTEELEKLYQIAPDCDTRGHVYTLKTAEGEFYPFLPVDTAAAIWMDERFRQRELQVTARIIFATFAISPRTNPAPANAARNRSSSAKLPPKTTIRNSATEAQRHRDGKTERWRVEEMERKSVSAVPLSISVSLCLCGSQPGP
jgi:hypothetical protein